MVMVVPLETSCERCCWRIRDETLRSIVEGIAGNLDRRVSHIDDISVSKRYVRNFSRFNARDVNVHYCYLAVGLPPHYPYIMFIRSEQCTARCGDCPYDT